MRVTRLLDDGSPDAGSNNLYVTDALTTLTATPVYADADEIEVKNACGVVCVSAIGDDTFKRLDVTLSLCTPDPQLAELLTGGSVLSPPGGGSGYAYPEVGTAPGQAVSIELWAKRIDPTTGDLASDFPYNRWLFPKVKNLRVGERTFENGAFASPYSGRAFGNTEWYDGPEADWPYPTVQSSRVAQFIPVTTIPDTACGYQTATGS
jgi:hypothetical protein